MATARGSWPFFSSDAAAGGARRREHALELQAGDDVVELAVAVLGHAPGVEEVVARRHEDLAHRQLEHLVLHGVVDGVGLAGLHALIAIDAHAAVKAALRLSRAWSSVKPSSTSSKRAGARGRLELRHRLPRSLGRLGVGRGVGVGPERLTTPDLARHHVGREVRRAARAGTCSIASAARFPAPMAAMTVAGRTPRLPRRRRQAGWSRRSRALTSSVPRRVTRGSAARSLASERQLGSLAHRHDHAVEGQGVLRARGRAWDAAAPRRPAPQLHLHAAQPERSAVFAHDLRRGAQVGEAHALGLGVRDLVRDRGHLGASPAVENGDALRAFAQRGPRRVDGSVAASHHRDVVPTPGGGPAACRRRKSTPCITPPRCSPGTSRGTP